MVGNKNIGKSFFLTGWTLKDKELEIILFSMRKIYKVLTSVKNPVLKQVISYLCLELASKAITTYVRKPITIWQYAWVDKKFISTQQRLNKEHPNNNQIYDHSKSVNNSKYYENKDNFHQWLVGFTDGDGSFSVIRVAERKWTLFFKISQSTYNLRILYFIKRQLGVGSVHVEADSSKKRSSFFWIRNRNIIGQVIIPIFDKYPLLTSKALSCYELFKKAYYLLEDKSLNSELLSQSLVGLEAELNSLLNLKINKINQDLVNPHYSHLNTESRDEDITSVISESWLIGFVEAKGRFRIANLDNEFKFEFYIEQKQDKLLLLLIKRVLHIKNVVRSAETDSNNFVLCTRNSYAINNIIKQFSNKFRGINSLNFKIWSRAYLRDNNQTKIAKSYNLLTKFNHKFYMFNTYGSVT